MAWASSPWAGESWAGQPASGTASYTLTCDAGAYTLAGQAATLLKNSVVTADVGAYALVGQDATFAYSGATVARRHAGGFARRAQVRKGYIIKGRRYFLTEDELAVHIATMLQEVSRGEIKQITAGKPKPITRKTWEAIKPVTDAITLIAEDEDEEALLMLM